MTIRSVENFDAVVASSFRIALAIGNLAKRHRFLPFVCRYCRKEAIILIFEIPETRKGREKNGKETIGVGLNYIEEMREKGKGGRGR